MRTLIFIFILLNGLMAASSTAFRAPAADGKVVVLAAKGSSAAQNPQALELQATPAPNSPVAILSFLEWKSVRVTEAQQKLDLFTKGQLPSGEEKTSEQNLKFNVDVALQLGIQDYFSMYMKSLDAEDFKEATRKLTQEEAAELLLTYRNSLEKEKKILPKFTKSPKSNATGKNSSL